jgi:hypothetical protein
MERKLGTIRTVLDIKEITGADKIEIVMIDGWQCVSKKGVFKPGDSCIYIEIDSVVPPIKYFDFMADRKYRVKTIKLKGVISQGLVLPLGDLEVITKELGIKKYTITTPIEDNDITELIGLKKWVSQEEQTLENESKLQKKIHNPIIKFLTRFQWFRSLFKKRSKSFPEFIPKTDEERIQNIPFVLKDKTENKFYATEKIDGTSTTYFWYKKKFGVCSRNVLKFENDNSWWSTAARELGIKTKLKMIKKDIAIQGELIGPKIQGDKYKTKSYKLYLYGIWDIKQNKYYSFQELKDFCCAYNFNTVPIIHENYTLPDTVEEIIRSSEGFSSVNNSTLREGLVIREKENKYRNRISFKAINPQFLLNHGE